MCYQPNEYYFVRKLYIFSHLRNIIIPEAGVRVPNGPVARGQPKSCWANQRPKLFCGWPGWPAIILYKC